MRIEELLHEEIEAELGTLAKLNDVGSDTHKATVDSVSKLVDRVIEFEKVKAATVEAEAKLKAEENKQAAEAEMKLKELDDKKKDRVVDGVIAGAGILLPLGVTIWGACKSFEFEKEGSITTLMGRGFMNKLLKK